MRKVRCIYQTEDGGIGHCSLTVLKATISDDGKFLEVTYSDGQVAHIPFGYITWYMNLS